MNLGLRRLAADMIALAVSDLEPVGGTLSIRRKRVSACTWLASRAATPWFDLVGIDQARTLRNVGWSKHARDLLRLRYLPDDTDEELVTMEEARVLRNGLRVLEAA